MISVVIVLSSIATTMVVYSAIMVTSVNAA